jgi:uncharacterized protein YndB with AHSA1/START domain
MAASKNDLKLTRPPTVKAEMLIRKPVSEVFQAFVDPRITSKFWFSKSSGKLKPGAKVTWDWEMHNVSVPANVKAIEENKRILVEWTAYGSPTAVEWQFTDRDDDTTFVSITESGFEGSADEIVAAAIGSEEGFTLVLAGLKALLEHKVDLNLVADRFPDGIGEH